MAEKRERRFKARLHDGRQLVMRELSVFDMSRIAMQAADDHPENPMAHLAASQQAQLQAAVVRVGDRVPGKEWTSEQLVFDLGPKGVVQARLLFSRIHSTSEEEDAAFLASIEAL